jgi:CheY-like chemotaxis protein
MREVAELAGFRAIVAHDGSELATLLETKPTLLVLDLAMPTGDGIEVIRHLAAAQFTGRLILVSGFDQLMLESAKTLAEIQGLHVAGVLTKAIRAEALRNLLLDSDR